VDAIDPLISVRDAAQAIGLNKRTLERQIASGAVRAYGGRVRLSEVLQDRLDNVDLSRSHRRDGVPDAFDVAAVAEDDDALSPNAANLEVVLRDGEAMPYAAARALRETLCAQIKMIELGVLRKELVPIDVVADTVAQEYSVIRERFLCLPAMASRLVGKGSATIETMLQEAVREILEELHDPAVARDG
jgi:hypothetical protein